MVKAIVAIEPMGPPFADIPYIGSLAWGLTAVPLTWEPLVGSPEELRAAAPGAHRLPAPRRRSHRRCDGRGIRVCGVQRTRDRAIEGGRRRGPSSCICPIMVYSATGMGSSTRRTRTQRSGRSWHGLIETRWTDAFYHSPQEMLNMKIGFIGLGAMGSADGQKLSGRGT